VREGQKNVSENNSRQALNSFFAKKKKCTGNITRNKNSAGGSVAPGRVSYVGQYAGDNPGIPSSSRLEFGRETDKLAPWEEEKKILRRENLKDVSDWD
jgi:hypothetical protein